METFRAEEAQEACCVVRCEEPGIRTKLTVTDDGEAWMVWLCEEHRQVLNRRVQEHES